MKMSAKFLLAVEEVLKNEGGYVNHPSDPGGATNFGITQRTYPQLNIRTLTVAQAKEIYYVDWWTKGPYESITSQAIATKLFDTAVNTGTKRAFKFLQQACNNLGSNLKVDGVIGPKTIERVNSLPASSVLAEMRKEQAAFYTNLAAKRPSMKVFLRGWLNRAAR